MKMDQRQGRACCIGDGYVLQQRAIDRFQCVALAALEYAVGDGDVDKAAIGFRAALDAAGGVIDYTGANFLKVPFSTEPVRNTR